MGRGAAGAGRCGRVQTSGQFLGDELDVSDRFHDELSMALFCEISNEPFPDSRHSVSSITMVEFDMIFCLPR